MSKRLKALVRLSYAPVDLPAARFYSQADLEVLAAEEQSEETLPLPFPADDNRYMCCTALKPCGSCSTCQYFDISPAGESWR